MPFSTTPPRTLVPVTAVFACCLAVTIVSARPAVSPVHPASVPGRVIIIARPSGDDTQRIQSAIDEVAKSGGVVLFGAGHYRHTGLIGRANVHLRGVQMGAVKLDHTPKAGDGITLVPHPDNFMISDITVTSSGRSTGWAIRAREGSQRSLRIERTRIGGFVNGIEIRDALCVSIRQCKIGHTYPTNPRGIGVLIGDGRKHGGNGVTIEDCYFNSLDKAVVTHAQACLVSRPIIELCHTGVETHGITTVVSPWVDGTTDKAHFSVQQNTIGGGRSGTGVLLFGYGSSSWKLDFATEAERQRSIILPERLDFAPGADPSKPRGVSLGRVVIDRDGVIHANGFKTLPKQPKPGKAR